MWYLCRSQPSVLMYTSTAPRAGVHACRVVFGSSARYHCMPARHCSGSAPDSRRVPTAVVCIVPRLQHSVATAVVSSNELVCCRNGGNYMPS